MDHPRPATVDMLRRLVAFDTSSRESNLALIHWVRDYLKGHGVDSLLVHDEAGRKANLFATIGSNGAASARPGVVLAGHTDVVPVDGQDWSSDPFALAERDGRLYGRGACDMKGFIAVALALVPELVRARPGPPLHLALSYDEEVGKVAFGCEAGLYDAAGIPSVICGPSHIDQAHKPDEFVSLAQLAECERFLRRIAAEPALVAP